MVESLKLCLQLLMLLGKMIYNQSAVQHCPLQNIVPNFTTEAGSPFNFNILLNATKTDLGNLKISLANGNLPPWVEYRHESGHLVGLALPEDCGIHHIQLHITTHNCTANVFVHVRNATIHGNSPKRDMSPCPDREISIWGNLLLGMSPVHLNASQRLHLVNTVADLLHLQGNSISLFSSKNFNVHFHEMLKVCSPSNLQEDFEKAATLRNLTQVLWRFGCKSQEQLFFLQDKLNNAFVRDILMKQLDIPIFALRFLCTVEVAHKVKRDLRSDVSTFLSQLSSATAQGYRTNDDQTFAQTNDITLNYFVQSSDTFSSDRTESDMGTLLLSFENNITPVLPTQLHVTTNFQRLPTSSTPGSDQGWSDIWTETYGYSHSESARPVPLKSLDYSDFTQESSDPSVSDSHQTQTYGVSLSFSSDQSHQSSNATLLSQMFSPTPHLSHPSNTEQTDPKIPPTVSGARQEAISRINATLRDLTLTTLVSQTAQNTLESSMHVFFTTGPTTYTPPLPFAYSTSDTYDKNPTFSMKEYSNSQDFSTTQQNESHLLSEISSCTDKNGQAHCSSQSDDSQFFPTSLLHLSTQELTQNATISNMPHETILSELTQNNLESSMQILSNSYLINSERTQLSSVSPHSSNVYANLNTTTMPTATTSPSVTYPDHISTYGTSATVSNQFETIAPPTGLHTSTSSNSNSLEMSHIEETLYSSMFLSSTTQNVLLTHELEQNPTISNMPLETILSEMTQNNLESSIQILSNSYPINSELIQPSSVSSHISNVFAYLNTTTMSTATTSPSVTYPDQISSYGISATVSSHFETIAPPTDQQIFTSSTRSVLKTSHVEENLYASIFLSTQNVLPTHELVENATTSNMPFETIGKELTQNNLESSLFYSNTPEPSESMHTLPLIYDYSTIGLSWTSGNIDPTFGQDESILQDFSSITPHSDFAMETQSRSDVTDSNNICSYQNGQSYCFGILRTSELSNKELSSFQSTSEGMSLLQTTEILEKSQQTNIVQPLFTTYLSNTQTMLFTDEESQYGTSYLSNTLSTALLPTVINSIDLSASESIATTSYFEEIASSAVHEPYTASSINILESLEPSFPLCNSVDFSGCASAVISTLPGNTNTNEYWTSFSVDSMYWTSEVELSEQTYSTTWQNAKTEEYSSFNPKSYTYITILATSVQLSQNYLSASHQIPTDTLPPSYMTSLSIMTFVPHGSSALTEHCEIERGSLLNCQSSIQASVDPAKQSTHFGLYSAVSTTLLQSGGHSSSDITKLSTSSVTAASTVNFPPQVLQTIPALTATVGFPFSYAIPENTFVDPEDGTADALSLEMRLIDPPPPSVGSWLSLDGLQLHGIPLEMDTHFAPQHAILLSQDKDGLSTSMKFTIYLFHNPVQPCHVFTISARLSLHSILLHRHKMELFLTKISAYFNNTIANHLSIVSVSPGSTVVSWYNYSLCDNGTCHREKINSMWLAMRFENSMINPKFIDAMLPEFPLINVEPVAYTQDCFPLTHIPTTTFKTTSEYETTSNFSTSPSITQTSEQVPVYGEMASMFIALLVICSLILIVIFITVIVYFCQRTPRVVAIFPASRMLSVRSVDSRTLRPRRALLLHPEIPPPPLSLWINLNQDDDLLSSEIQQQQSDSDPRQLPFKYNSSNI